MICENCKQRPAKVTVTQMHNGDQVQGHYCEVCAKNFHPFHLEFQQDPFIASSVISNWLASPEQQTSTTKTSTRGKMQSCGWTFRQFLNQGKFGCAHCYESFHEQLPGVFKQLHNGNVKHVGKAPGAFGETYN